MRRGQLAGQSFARSTLAAAAPTVGVAMPFLLVGTLAVRLRNDLGFDEAALGLAVASTHAAMAVSSVPMGRAAERFGAARGLRLGTLAALGTMLSIAALVDRWATLVVFLALSGGVATWTMASGDLWLARAVPAERQGFAFGIRQAAAPASAILAGLAVPTLAVTVGWRWTFATVGALVGLAGLAVPRSTRDEHEGRRSVDRSGDVSMAPMVVLAVAYGLGAAGAFALTTFLVSAVVEAGLSESSGGLLFSLGAVLAVVTRLVLGHLADRRSRSQLRVVAVALGFGAVAYFLLATGDPRIVVVAAPIAFAGGWGWSGLFDLSMVRANPNAPAAGAAITRTGGAVGGILGPLVFGFLAHRSYSLAWAVTGAWTLLGAVVVVLGRYLVIRGRDVGRWR